MIMRQGQQLLLPANPLFIFASLLAALGLNMLQNIGWFGRAAWAPDMLALVLAFWCVHQPRRVGISIAFFFGLLMDVHGSALLGQHALAYAVLGYLAIALHRRLLGFSLLYQAVQVLPLFLAAHLLALLARMIGGAAFPGIGVFAAPLLESLLWPVVGILLLAPQHRAPDPDENRPL